METEITPEPSADERRALLTILGDGDEPTEPSAYRSPWRLAGFGAGDEDD